MIGANPNKHLFVFGAFEKSLPLVILDVFVLRTHFEVQHLPQLRQFIRIQAAQE